MDKKLVLAVFGVAALLTLTACSDTPEPLANEAATAASKKEPPKPPEPVAAQTAFYEMYKPARAWATDLLPLSLASGEVSNLKNEGGKAAMWSAVFVSPSRREARTFFYSAVDDGPNIHKGVTAGGSQAWSGPTANSRPFQTTEFVTNSEAAYQTAVTKAAAWLKKNPGKKVTFFLGASSRFPQPVWYIQWGTSKAGYAAYINATTGLPAQ